MEIAKYFATLGFKVTKGEIKKVDDFLGTIEKGLKTAGKEADVTEKATKKVKKSTDETTKAIKQQLTWQEKLNKFKEGELKLTFAIAQNQKQLARNFKQSVDAMVIKPTTAKKLKEQQALYSGLFGAVTPKAMVGAKGSNQGAWSRQFNQRIQQLTQQSKTNRASRQADLEAVFGLPKAQSNPRVAALINERLGYMGGRKSDALSDMAAYYRNEEKVAKLKTDAQKKIEESEKRILAARKRDIEQRIRNAQRRMNQRATATDVVSQALSERKSLPPRSASSVNRMNYLHAGGAVGALARYGVGSIPFVGGVYGLAAMNQGIQEIQSTEIAANSIFGDRAEEARKWLEKQADFVGFNYLETMPIFSSFMASSMPLMGFEQSQGVFEAISQFGRTRGADPVSMKRAMTAIQQMASKGQVMAEELKNQLSEAKGFGESRQIFAEAYQMSIGGNLQGAEASAALMDAMQKGDVKAGDILPLVAQIMKARSAGGIEQARMSLTAEQMRFQNEQTRQLKAFGESGGMEGYARIFRAMTIALKESEPLVRAFARGFNEASKFVSEVLLNVQSIQRFFQGRDSWFGDTFFGTEERRNAAFEWLGSIRTLMGEIGELVGTIFRGWGMIFDLLMSSEVMNALTNIQNTFTNIIGAINSMANGDYTGAMQQMKAAFLDNASISSNVYNPAAHKSSLEGMKIQTAADRRKAGFPGTLGVFPMSQEEQATRAMRGTGSYATSSLNNVVVESGAIIVNTQATDGDKLAEELRPHLQQMFRVEQTRTFTEAMLMVPQKE